MDLATAWAEAASVPAAAVSAAGADDAAAGAADAVASPVPTSTTSSTRWVTTTLETASRETSWPSRMVT